MWCKHDIYNEIKWYITRPKRSQKFTFIFCFFFISLLLNLRRFPFYYTIIIGNVVFIWRINKMTWIFCWIAAPLQTPMWNEWMWSVRKPHWISNTHDSNGKEAKRNIKLFLLRLFSLFNSARELWMKKEKSFI